MESGPLIRIFSNATEEIPNSLKAETKYWNPNKNFPILSKTTANEILTAIKAVGKIPDDVINGIDPREALKNTLGAHSIQTAILCGAMLDEWGAILPEWRLLIRGALLHDCGKLNPEIKELVQNGKELKTEKEWEIVKRHPGLGRETMKELRIRMENQARNQKGGYLCYPGMELFMTRGIGKAERTLNAREALKLEDTIRFHHENTDATGYNRIPADRIPQIAKMIRVADASDAMGDRPRKHRKDPFNIIQTIAELERCSGNEKWNRRLTERQELAHFFDPGTVGLMKKVAEKIGDAEGYFFDYH